MDPNVALAEINEMIEEKDVIGAIFAIRDLRAWISIGGCLPKGWKGKVASIKYLLDLERKINR